LGTGRMDRIFFRWPCWHFDYGSYTAVQIKSSLSNA
jgi:hypothetical protein